MFQQGGKPRFKSFKRGLNSIEGTDNHEIMYKPEQKAIVWRRNGIKYMKPDTDYMKEALASDRRVKYCRIVRRTPNGKKTLVCSARCRGCASRSQGLCAQMRSGRH